MDKILTKTKSKAETTQESVTRVTSEIGEYSDKLAQAEAHISSIEAAECSFEEVKRLPDLKQEALEFRILVKGCTTQLDSLKAKLLAENITSLIEDCNGHTEGIEVIIKELLYTLREPMALAFRLNDLWMERVKLLKKAMEASPGDGRIQELPTRVGGVVQDFLTVSVIAMGITKYYAKVYGGDYARNALEALDSPEALVKIVDEIEKAWLSECADAKTRAKAEQPRIQARLEHEAAKKRLNAPAQSKAEKTTEIILAKRAKEQENEDTEKALSEAKALREDMGVSKGG